ncbi:MAG: hypothetical protein KC561_09640, partial [Myxococcales bacterium]|nr:hypothetical protein [Myxococcales bacterium]
MKTLTRSTVLLAICALLAFTACDESSPGGTTDVTDDSSRGGRDANNNLTDVSVNNDAGGDTSMGSDSTSSTFDCSVLTVPTDEGDECVDQSSCQGGSCAALSQNDDPTCYRSCVPTAGVCDDACGSGTQCVPLTDQGGNALTFNDGTPRGACVVPPSGDQGPNEYCDTSGDYTCDTSTTAGCAAFEQGATSGQCVVECSQGDT